MAFSKSLRLAEKSQGCCTVPSAKVHSAVSWTDSSAKSDAKWPPKNCRWAMVLVTKTCQTLISSRPCCKATNIADQKYPKATSTNSGEARHHFVSRKGPIPIFCGHDKTSLQNHISWESFMWSTLKCLVPSQNCIGLCRMHQMHHLWKSSWKFLLLHVKPNAEPGISTFFRFNLILDSSQLRRPSWPKCPWIEIYENPANTKTKTVATWNHLKSSHLITS